MYKDKILYIGVFCIAMAVSISIFNYNINANNQWEYVSTNIRSGDTLWDIGRAFAKEDEDVREVMERIYKENNLKNSSSLHPGQKIIVPVKQVQNDFRLAFNKK